MLRSRKRGQSIVEFGIIAILFTLIMFAIADFGLLLNDWLSVSSGARQLARDASVGMYSCPPGHCLSIGGGGGVTPDLWNEASKLSIAGVSQDSFPSYCCTAGPSGSAIQLNVTYYNQCTPGVASASGNPCREVNPSELDGRYSSNGVPGGCTPTATSACFHPAGPGIAGNCSNPSNPPFCPGDTVVLTLTAAGAQVITPLVRPFFTNSTTCPSNSAHCYVPLSSTVTLRFEGDTL